MASQAREQGNGIDHTIDDYDKHATTYARLTADLDVSKIRDRFLEYVLPGGYLLDLGCGPGRDSAFFEHKNYQVTALDGSGAMCRLARQTLCGRVIHRRFSDMEFQEEFDGVWACASLLHVESGRQADTWRRVAAALKFGGYAYASYKYGDFEGVRAKRFYLDMTEATFGDLLQELPQMKLVDQWVSVDQNYDGAKQKWLHNILRKR